MQNQFALTTFAFNTPRGVTEQYTDEDFDIILASIARGPIAKNMILAERAEIVRKPLVLSRVLRNLETTTLDAKGDPDARVMFAREVAATVLRYSSWASARNHLTLHEAGQL